MAEITKKWLTTVGGIKVERCIRDGGKLPNVKRSFQMVPLRQEENAVLHTTEGHWAGSLNVFVTRTGTPTWMLGYETLKTVGSKLTNKPASASTRIRVAQFMPIGEMALTLENDSGGTETNREALCQIELIGTCVQGANGFGPWLPDDPVLEVLQDLFVQIHNACGVPLQHAGNGTRSVAVWDGKAGWFGHGEVPENAHTDPRGFRWKEAFAVKPTLKTVWQVRSGGQTLHSVPAVPGPPDGLTRILQWMHGAGETKVRAAEKKNGSVSVRKVTIPA